ncbi:MAG: UbiA family prenyltransferase [Ktedonobacteraceae bacterium]|nr:UbiA family prenyltransferase [Ktedonobacteraceae bacterium]
MQIVRKRRPAEIVLGLFLISHPIPVLFHVIAVTLFTLLAAWTRFRWDVVALVIAAHAAMQLSIAMLNDYCDRDLDAVSKPQKPIPRGLIRPAEALTAGLLMIVLMLLLLVPLNMPALLISLAYLVLGQAYNLGLKSTPLSGIVFALAMPLIPLYAFAGVGRTLPLLAWLVPVGALLGVALNLANSLPDIEEDAAHGAHTLAVVLGVRRTLFACPLLLVLTALLIGVLTITGLVPARPWIVGIAIAFTCLVGTALICFVRAYRSVQARKAFFYLVTVACIVLAGGWLLGAIA